MRNAKNVDYGNYGNNKNVSLLAITVNWISSNILKHIKF